MRSEEIYRYSRLQATGDGLVCLSDTTFPETQFSYTDTADSPNLYRLYAALPFLGRWRWPFGARLERTNPGGGDLLVLFSGQITIFTPYKSYTLGAGERLLLHDKRYTIEVQSRIAADLLLLTYSGSLCENIERLFNGQVRQSTPVPVTEPVAQLLKEAVACMRGDASARPAVAANVVVRLMTALYTHSPEELYQNGAEPSWFLIARQYLEMHYRQKLSVEALAAACSCSVSHFYRLFRAYTGVSPYQYLLRLRIEHGRRLLEQEDYSVKYVSYAVGFSAPNHFIRYFKQQTGFTPEIYARLCKSAAAESI